MSIIGPRPALTYHPWPLEDYSELQRKRMDLRPGVGCKSSVKREGTKELNSMYSMLKTYHCG